MLQQHASSLHVSTQKLAARVCSIGAETLSTLGALAQHQRLMIGDASDSVDAARLLQLLEINQQLVEYLREVHALCELHGDITSARLIAALLDEAEHRSFQLFQIVNHR